MVEQSKEQMPELMLKALLEFGGKTTEGDLIQAVALPCLISYAYCSKIQRPHIRLIAALLAELTGY